MTDLADCKMKISERGWEWIRTILKEGNLENKSEVPSKEWDDFFKSAIYQEFEEQLKLWRLVILELMGCENNIEVIMRHQGTLLAVDQVSTLFETLAGDAKIKEQEACNAERE